MVLAARAVALEQQQQLKGLGAVDHPEHLILALQILSRVVAVEVPLDILEMVDKLITKVGR
jgi:hypothetical protein